MGLSEEIEHTRKEIRTDGYPMSLGELLSMYSAKEIFIQPEFQRYFRWKDDQKSRLIESILLGIPIPSIFVSQRPDGVWEVIDGLQRLSTIFQFVGVLAGPDGLVPPLILSKTKYLPSLEGKMWAGENGLDREQQLLIKRAKINITIIHRESDPQAKYELFQRLNTGGSPLSPQEIRNCILMMVEPTVLPWLRTLSERESFKKSWKFTDRQLEQQYHLELVVRFLVFRNQDLAAIDTQLDLDFVLTEQMLALIQSPAFRMEDEATAFNKVFDDLFGAMGEDTFRRRNEEADEYQGRGLNTAFDLLAVAYGGVYEGLLQVPDFNKVKEVLNDDGFRQKTKAGTRALTKLRVAVAAGRERMKP
jgi:hypothetical protein